VPALRQGENMMFETEGRGVGRERHHRTNDFKDLRRKDDMSHT
jgi:hypothetical protein